ncbi:MAG: hypothetical protein K2G37_03290 [Clostridia bacterium]|nr:hypothetical protein [Clostridia bacterium]MDE7328833.1 hypothetical protein [Clostridia bacterium]
MRKKINVIIIVSIILAMCLFAMVACSPERDDDGLLKLKAPQNLEFSGSTLSWDEVENAELYYISIEGSEEESSTTSTSFNLSPIVSGYGDFTVFVRAYGDGKTYGTSDASKTVYHKGNSLDTPKVTIDNEGKLASWSAVSDAASYSIRVYDGDDSLLLDVTTEQTSFSFADRKDDDGKAIFDGYDKYRFVIVAVPSDYSKFSDSDRGTFYYINSKVLDTPKFSSITTSRIQWGSVTNASSYTLKMTYVASDGTSDEITVDTTGTSYQRSNFNYDRVGVYTFTIKANGDNEVFIDSAWSEEDDKYSVSKLEGIDAKDLKFAYNKDGNARLTWSIDANTKSDQFYLTLVGLLPNGTSKLENSVTSLTVSCNVVFVKGQIYNFYQYTDSNKTAAQIVDGRTITVYNIDGDMMVRYNGADKPVLSTSGSELRYSSYVKSDGVDIVFDGSNFIYEKDVEVDGDAQDQYTGDDEDVFDLSTGNQLYYFEESSSDSDVEKSVIFNGAHEPIAYKFAIDLDSIFIKEVNDGTATTYEYKINDASYYGILYDVSVSAGQSDDKYVASEEAVAKGQYLSYKIPTKTDQKYTITNAGEYAYIILKDYIDTQNGVGDGNDYVITNNINFNGYEVVQIQNFNGTIEGNQHTVSNIVVGNKRLTADGVVTVDTTTRNYAQFVNIASGSRIDNTFYMGVNFVGYEKEESDEDVDGEEEKNQDVVSEINVALIAINNYGTLNKVFVQSDSIKADGANVAGMVINNYNVISVSQVYAELEGRNVAGVAINVEASQGDRATISETGFYGSLTARVGEFFEDHPSTIAAAGIALNVNESGIILRCEAVGQITAEGSGLNALYAGGLVARNSGMIVESYCGEYTREANEATIKYVIANGNNGYAGGLVAYNSSTGKIQDSYATNRVNATEFVGGFVGMNEGEITRSYAVGGTVAGGANNGAFAGSNSGTISYVAAYSNSSQVRVESYLENIKEQSDLARIVEVLYRDANDKLMTVTDEEGFRYPILVGKTYTKDYVVEMSRNQIDPKVSGIAVISGGQEKGEVKTLTIDEDYPEEYIFGDSSAKGNKVVIVLNLKDNVSGGNYIKLIYGVIK